MLLLGPGSHVVMLRGVEKIFRHYLGKVYKVESPLPHLNIDPVIGIHLLLHFYCWGPFTFPGLCWGKKRWEEKWVYRQAQLSRHTCPFSVPSVYPVLCPSALLLRQRGHLRALFKDLLLYFKHCAICFSNLLDHFQIPGTRNHYGANSNCSSSHR